jgi:hypothetical protein
MNIRKRKIDREYVLSSCHGKIVFECRSMAQRIQNRRAKTHDGKKHHEVYFCRVCDGFHIGSRPKKRSGRPVDRKKDRYGEVRL